MASSQAIPFAHAIDRKFVDANAGPPPLLILLHGSGDDEFGLLEIGRILAPACGGALIVSLRGPRPRGSGYCCFEGSSASPAPNAEASIAGAAQKVVHLLQKVPSDLGTDPTRAYMFGHSQGASISCAVALSTWPRPDLVRGVVCNSGRLFPGFTQPNSLLGQLVAGKEALSARHILITHGQDDHISPIVHGRQNKKYCQELGMPHTYHEHDEGHNDLRKPLGHAFTHLAFAQRMSSLPTTFIHSALPGLKDFEASLLLPDAERFTLEQTAAVKLASSR